MIAANTNGAAASGTSAVPSRGAGRPRREAVAARQDELLKMALEQFLTHGYAHVSLAMVARAARVAMRTIYTKFGGKEGILAAVIDAERARHQEELAALGLDQMDLGSRLNRMAHHLAQRSSRPQLMRLYAMVAAEGSTQVLQALYAAGPGQAMAVLLAMFSRPEAEGLFRQDLSKEQLCEHFFSCVCGSHAMLLAPSQMPGVRAEQGLSLFLRAVMCDQGEGDVQ
jgi:TetR/AcrR family transcriptional repressor of mexJK operon